MGSQALGDSAVSSLMSNMAKRMRHTTHAAPRGSAGGCAGTERLLIEKAYERNANEAHADYPAARTQ